MKVFERPFFLLLPCNSLELKLSLRHGLLISLAAVAIYGQSLPGIVADVGCDLDQAFLKDRLQPRLRLEHVAFLLRWLFQGN